MNNILSEKKVSDFTSLLSAYSKAGISLKNAVDGGAGSGLTAKQMLEHMNSESKIFAFEPFPGNHRFFDNIGSQVMLIPKALSDKEEVMYFRVPSIVKDEDEWGKRGFSGYSSVGYLDKSIVAENESSLKVECVKADDVIPSDCEIDFIKLDLQGGELNALKGMSRLLNEVHFMWVEYSGNDHLLLDYIIDSGFLVFDTEYFFLGSPTKEVLDVFEITKSDLTLSTNAKAFFGFKMRPWGDFKNEFTEFKRTYNLVQTDLVCVNRKFINEFLLACTYLK